MTQPFFLDSRAVVSVSGADSDTFLHGLLTCATLDMSPGQRRAGALLTPQGKVSVETLLERTADGFLIDCDASAAPGLVKKLTMFRLRAAVSASLRDDLCVVVFDGAPDPRTDAAPRRCIVDRADAQAGDASHYHAARIGALAPEQGADYGFDEVFPADVNMDLTGGVDFRKGCYVGQEVVSRMKRRGTARRRTLLAGIAGPSVVPPCPVSASDGSEVGVVTSIAGSLGLARVRIDRLGDTSDTVFMAGGAAVVFKRPPWLDAEQAAIAAARETRT